MSTKPTNAQPATPAGTLAGQVALVTGGGRGLGQVYAGALAAAGAAVAVAARSADELDASVRLVEAAGGTAIAVCLDVTDRPAVEVAVHRIEHQLGPIDLLVNNAGIWGPIDAVADVDPDQWWRTLEINLRGGFLCTHAVLPTMIGRHRGRIINIASHAGVFRWPFCSAYSVSKAAIIKLTENLAFETKRDGIAVFAFHPGITAIGLTTEAMTMDAQPGTAAGRAAGYIRQEVAEMRAVPPEEGARIIVVLASGRADALTGCYIAIDDDLDDLIARADEVQKDDLYTLRLRTSR